MLAIIIQNLKTIRFIIFFILIHQSLFSQKSIVGKIEFYTIVESKPKPFKTFSENFLRSLKSKKHRLTIIQEGNKTKIKTDSSGFFKIELKTLNQLKIEVYKKRSFLNQTFYFNPKKNIGKDTVYFRISNKKLEINFDSIQAPIFFKEYNEKMAELDFKNRNARILGSGNWLIEEIVEKRKKLSEKYNFKYEYIFGCLNSKAERRIAYRYNEKMKKLIGIKNVW